MRGNCLLSISIVILFSLVGCVTASTYSDTQDSGSFSAHIYHKDFDTVFIKAIKAADKLGWKVILADSKSGTIHMKTQMNLSAFGESVAVSVSRQENSTVRVDVAVRVDVLSKTKHLVDWGKNARNISDYYYELDELVNASH